VSEWVRTETSFPRQSIALLRATENKETKHHIQPKHKREMEDNCPS